MPKPVYPNPDRDIIRVTFYEHDAPFSTFPVEANKATQYVEYAQLCGYGISLELIDLAEVTGQ